jgi:hypothetical protein
MWDIHGMLQAQFMLRRQSRLVSEREAGDDATDCKTSAQAADQEDIVASGRDLGLRDGPAQTSRSSCG